MFRVAFPLVVGALESKFLNTTTVVASSILK